MKEFSKYVFLFYTYYINIYKLILHQYFINKLSCPTQSPNNIFNCVPLEFKNLACPIGLHIGSNSQAGRTSALYLYL